MMEKMANWKMWVAVLVSLAFAFANCPEALAYAFNLIVPDVRQPSSVSGGSACPARAHQLTAAGNISFRWSTALGSNPAIINTQAQDPVARLTEIERSVTASLAVWTA